MGRKSKVQAGPGQVLIKQRTQAQMKERLSKATAKHNKPLESQIDVRDLDDVMEQAELAGKVFSADNPLAELLIAPETDVDALEATKEERRAEEALHASSLTIPRRPKWTASMTPQQLDLNERQSFLTWRRGLAELEDNEKLVLTPFEKNLDIWRQLWRVLERCDLVVMVVDARNPLFYRCPDLEAYVKELDPNRKTMLLLNKSDLLTRDARHKWATYLKEQGIPYMFWSAKVATAILEGKEEVASIVDEEEADDEDAVVLERDELLGRVQKMAEDIAETRRIASQASLSKHLETHGSTLAKGKSETDPGVGSSSASGRVMVGFVGYPNVGKSSTINALVGEKKTGVTSTPGKTKHFQTLIISDKLMLCDCPGLVFPSFTTSRSEMVAAGVLPVDRMTDHRGPIQVVANKVPRAVLESTYGFTLPAPKPYENPNRPPTAAELLRAYAMSRGQVASSGLPDETRASRTILKDYLSGKLLFCYAPPNEEQAGFSQRIGTSSEVGDEDDDEDEDEFDPEEGSDDEDGESGSEGEDGEPSGSGSMGGKLLGVGDSNMADVFGDLDTLTIGADLRAPKTKNQKEKAPHKVHRKTARKKDRSWRVTNDGSDGMPSSGVVQKAVSHGAAKVRLSV
ncbi:hypothetical protein M758_4G095800 [Ceratodon purpureus]|nr:hypothetical protein M758_4G095800 [Ceratodon purpureus]